MLAILYLVILIVGLTVVALGVFGIRRATGSRPQSQSDTSSQVLRLVPISVGIGAAAFGVVGLALQTLTTIEAGLGVIWALGAGLLVGFAVQTLLYYRVAR